ncbi:MAG TPA: hypothetical protein ENI98_14880 [Gammaproteobacteria bacterium]|nr:hypothetical protein [Gammaproteobacteria bacterium]
MSNHITASILFSFKGKKHSPSLELDLDQYMHSNGSIPDLYPLIARANNFDLFSYEYEMMQAEPIKFSNPQGMVAEYVNKNILDIKAFESAWHEHKILQQLQKITANNMAIDDLEQHPELMRAMLQAYQLGKNSPQK